MRTQHSILQQYIRHSKLCVGILCLWGLASCANDTRFILKSSGETGITFENRLTASPNQNILNYIYFYNGGGITIADLNNDSLPDLIFGANQKSPQLYI